MTREKKPVLLVHSLTDDNDPTVMMENQLMGWFTALYLKTFVAPDNWQVVHLSDGINSDIRRPISVNDALLLCLNKMGLNVNALTEQAKGVLNHTQQLLVGKAKFRFNEAAIGVDFDGVPFHHFFRWHTANSTHAPALDAFSLGAMADGLGHFSWPVDDDKNIRSTLKVQMTCDSLGLSAALKDAALNLGVRQLAEQDITSLTEAGTGLSRLTIGDNQPLDCHRIFDCSKRPTTTMFTCDISAPTESHKASPKGRIAQAEENGWKVKAQLNNCYQQLNITFADAQNAVNSLGNDVVATPWQNNRIQVGHAYRTLLPVLDLSLKGLLLDLQRVCTHLPLNAPTHDLIDSYNQQALAESLQLVWFSWLPELARIAASQGWESVIEQCPAELAEQLRFFRDTGFLPTLEYQIVPAHQWYGLLTGLGYDVNHLHPHVTSLSEQTLAKRLDNLAHFIKQSVWQLPTNQAPFS